MAAQDDDHSDDQPQFVSAAFRTDVALPGGRAVLELEAADARTDRVELQLNQELRVEFRDDGRFFDRRAGDGVFAGIVPANLDEERAIFQRMFDGLRSGRPVPVFDGRELRDVVRSDKLIPEMQPGLMPILTTSTSTTVDIEHSVAITDLGVLESPDHTFNPCTNTGTPMGAWTFGHVMTELAGAMNPSDFAHEWLDTWTVDQVINGSVAPSRQSLHDDVLAAWPTLLNGDLDMSRAPFRPIAIMLRVDLRNTVGYGNGNAGEARIVYCFIDQSCQARKFIPIFEYAINKSGCAVKQWGEDWADLSTMSLGSPAYNNALEALTRQFTDVTSSPNANGLGQLRTNEFLTAPWELREFHLTSGLLTPNTVALTPDVDFNDTMILSDIINGFTNNLPAILGASALTGFSGANSGNPAAFWKAPSVIDNDDRHQFSLNTCNGCHRRETDTFFTHISEANFGQQPTLSGFLTGTVVIDPIDPFTSRAFDDLGRRRQDLQDLIDSSCFGVLVHHQAAFTH